jgi:hypothetical protein
MAGLPLNISYAPGSPYRVLGEITRQLMAQGIHQQYTDKAILATRYQMNNFRTSQVWTLQALAFPRGTIRKGNVLDTPTNTYHSPDTFFRNRGT